MELEVGEARTAGSTRDLIRDEEFETWRVSGSAFAIVGFKILFCYLI